MHLEHDVDLQSCNTLALPARTRHFCRADSEATLVEALQWADVNRMPVMVLGGGSNVVIAADWPGLTLQMTIRGKRVLASDEADRPAATEADDSLGATVEAAGGENWHELVQWSLANGLYGLENLTLIPGTVGAAPVQNIGAYGVELSDMLQSVRGWSVAEQCFVTLRADECRLAYRDSIFKSALRDRFVITAVTLRLRRHDRPVVSYPALIEALQAARSAAGIATAAPITAEEVERTVRAVRTSKLPDPALCPNAGSFFKNPVVERQQFERLKAVWPDMPAYTTDGDGDRIKVPAAWLLDRAGWKGHRRGGVGVHDRQALVLVHRGGGDGRALLALAEEIRSDIERRFGLFLSLEPRVYGQPGAAAVA